MSADTLRSLIERVERAAGPDRELDAAIGHAVGAFDRLLRGMGDDVMIASVTYQAEYDRAEILVRSMARSGAGLRYSDQVAPYTGAFDGAMTLVPPGAGIDLSRYWLMSRDGPVWSAVLTTALGGNENRHESEDRPNEALALTGAALRAKLAALKAPTDAG